MFTDETHPIKTLSAGLNNFQKVVMAATSILIVAMICIAVVARYIFNSDFYGSEELILMLAFWLYFMGAAQGSRERSQISADILNCYISCQRKSRIALLVKDFVTAAVCLLVTWWAIQFVAWGFTMNPKSAVFRLPMLIPHVAVGLGFVLMSMYHLVYLVQDAASHLRLSRAGE